LTATDGAAYDQFGYSVSLSGDTLVIGAHQAAVGSNWNQGAAYVFTCNQGGADAWGQVTKLTAADGTAEAGFGYSVSVSGDTLVIAAYGAAVGTHGAQGAAYVFYRNQGGADAWGQVTKLTAADGTALDWLGWSASLSGDTVALGAPYADVGDHGAQGAVYVFSRNRGGTHAWGQVAKLTSPEGATDDWFGASVSVSGDILVAGAHGAAVGGSDDQGAAYVFARNQGGADAWGQVAKLTAADGTALDWFGWSVAVSDDTVIVGAPYAAVGGNRTQGAAYLFYRNQGGADAWGQVAKLTADDGAAYDFFGISTAVNYGVAIVGAHGADVGGSDDQGAAYVFYRNQGGADAWGQAASLNDADGAALDRFSWSVSLSGDIAALGVPYADVGGNHAQGAAYLFTRDPGGAEAWAPSPTAHK
jgi:hypothetical protein